MVKGHKKKGSKFPVWSVIVTGLMILCGILAGIFVNDYLGTTNPEGFGEILGYAFVGSVALSLAIVSGAIGIGLFVVLIFIWGK